ncbi:Bro-N domain-containing protein [Komagataeibacter xylinus]|uniref:BRO-N domain-containing protein n=1 Tax=Komagataeibacter xylinus TaxID=28448 RepID=UPI00280B0A03|nr:Bro-N domain-containing protein [Komagataeibacter xylinus]
MTQNIIPFAFKGHEIRTVLVDGKPAFVGKDVGERLGYADPTNAMKLHCRGVVKRHPIVDSLGRTQNARIIFEPDVLRLIIKSKLPEAEEFERWVFDEVLPSIRKTGSYGAIKAPEQKPKRIRKPAFDVAFERCLRVASHLSNLDENQRLLMAARGTKELSGVNPLELMGVTSVAAPTQDNYLTPTQIGKEIGLSPIATNKLITTIGYQVKSVGSSVSSDYSMTDAGAKHGRMFDTTRRHGKGSQQQLKWSPNLVGILRAAMLADKDAPRPFAKAKESAPV